MRELLERLDGFAYDFRMRCGCGATVPVTAETYAREQSNEARVPCGSCGGEVHFGPAVAAIRRDDDPALDDGLLGQTAWYHTSTWSDWPSPSHGKVTGDAARRAAERFGLDADLAGQLATGAALHLGTYEAAVENLLRRMSDQDDSASQFFLYRVGVSVAPGRVNAGFRDENVEPASQISVAELDAANLDAVRYLNVREACGSLSLAVRPSCLAGLQRLAVPVPGLAPEVPAEHADPVKQLSVELTAVGDQLARTPRPDRRELARHHMVPDSERENRLSAYVELTDRSHELWNELEARLLEAFLGGVSAIVADAFTAALATWRHKTDPAPAEFVGRFAETSTLLTRSADVVRLAGAQPEL